MIQSLDNRLIDMKAQQLTPNLNQSIVGMRINENYAHIYHMKSRVNLTIDQELLIEAKKYARRTGLSVSELVEDYFKKLTRQRVEESPLFKMVKALPKPNLPEDIDYKKEYYKKRASKYDL